MATSGQFSCPPLGSFYWPLTMKQGLFQGAVGFNRVIVMLEDHHVLWSRALTPWQSGSQENDRAWSRARASYLHHGRPSALKVLEWDLSVIDLSSIGHREMGVCTFPVRSTAGAG
jgi:hypothetical protein